jgi:hypothetical protein
MKVAALIVLSVVLWLAAQPRAASSAPREVRSSAPPKGYRLQERLVIPALNAAGARSRSPLRSGEVYLVRVTGTVFTAEGTGPGFGDAEYVFRPDDTAVIDRCRDGTDLGVAINDTNISPDHTKQPRWGAFRRTHVYSRQFRGTGATILVDYHDCGYGDNRARIQQPGTKPLTLSIYAPVT